MTSSVAGAFPVVELVETTRNCGHFGWLSDRNLDMLNVWTFSYRTSPVSACYMYVSY